ncbi:MAG: hypothetical protein WAW37_20725 [Syntrophobacteraceae bacterium]
MSPWVRPGSSESGFITPDFNLDAPFRSSSNGAFALLPASRHPPFESLRRPCRRGHKITLRVGEALEILESLPGEKTDLVFIDADKQNYSAYYRESMRILQSGGLILADNALWYGGIFDPKDDDSRAMADFNELVKADDRAEKLFLTIRDGIYLIRKRVSVT